jgi:hypothetical protein
LDYWLRHKSGADFVAVDGGAVTRDGGPVPSGTVQSAIFGAITRWLHDRTTLPIWWTEFHVGRGAPSDQPSLVATVVAALLHMAEEDATVALYWQPQRSTDESDDRAPALWTSTDVTGGGQPAALGEDMAWMQQLMSDPADDLVSWPSENVGVLHGRMAFLAVNTAAVPADVRVQGVRLHLRPYEVRYVQLPAGTPPAPPSWWRPAVDACLREQPAPTR